MFNRDGTCRIPYDVYQRIDIGCKVEQDDVRIKVRIVSPIEREIKKIADAMKLRSAIVDKAVPYGNVIADELPEYSAKVIAAATLSIAAHELGMTIPINELAEVTGLSRDEIREVSRGKTDPPRTDDAQGLM
jgi:hypothetical protein